MDYYLNYTESVPNVRAQIRGCPGDFKVTENIGFEADGFGEHYLLKVEKNNVDSMWVLGQLARFAGVHKTQVGIAGLKDRKSVATQWVSVNLSGKNVPDWEKFSAQGVTILEWARHNKKIRRGCHKGNHFNIRLRGINGNREEVNSRLTGISANGVPNYFGEQRFGKKMKNLYSAERMFSGHIKVKDRFIRGMYLSAARSYIFNQLLSLRVAHQDWNRVLRGDVAVLDGTQSYFPVESIDEVLNERVRDHDIHPSGPLWGNGENPSRYDVHKIEACIANKYILYSQGLENAGLKSARRPLRLKVQQLEWSWNNNDLIVDFYLSRGSFATSVLREIAVVSESL